MCLEVCTQVAGRGKNLCTGGELFSGFFSSSPISRCWGNHQPQRWERLTHRAQSSPHTLCLELQHRNKGNTNFSSFRHEIPKISFTGISRTWLVAAGCKQSPEAVGKPWARLLFGVSGKEKATLPLVMGSQALQSCGVTHSIGVT